MFPAKSIFFSLVILVVSFRLLAQANVWQSGVIISEIMADPTPVTGLPEAEWIELKNTSGSDINLLGWRIGKSSSQSGAMSAFILKTDSAVIVCTPSAAAGLSLFSPVVTVTSFPSLANGGDLIYLRSPQGKVIHSVNYKDSWYKNELKRAGGWSLEMIDTRNPCTGMSNWAASVDVRGATPGTKNSIDGLNKDDISPKLWRAFAIDSLTVVLVFSETLDSTRSSEPAHYAISDGIRVATATPMSIAFDRVQLKLTTPLLRNKIYTITATGSKDCVGNVVNLSANTARLGLHEPLDSLDVIVNEILFNPRPGGADYVELHNRSSKFINLHKTYIANRTTGGMVSSLVRVIDEDYTFFPGEMVVLTEDVSGVTNNFIAIHPEAFIELASMPSYNDDNGSVVLLNEQGRIIDEVSYSEKWHFKLISNTEGIALERIDYNGRSDHAENWHSAAASVNYGTPTYKNSQHRLNEEMKGEIKISPAIFSPDNDGLDDFALVQYSFPQAGYVANITIFDATGRAVKYLQRNALSGNSGSYRWDGLDEKNKKLPVGLYIVYTEIFNLEGKSKRFKNTVVLARKN